MIEGTFTKEELEALPEWLRNALKLLGYAEAAATAGVPLAVAFRAAREIARTWAEEGREPTKEAWSSILLRFNSITARIEQAAAAVEE